MSMSIKQIEQLCQDKEQELIEKYFRSQIYESTFGSQDVILEYTPDISLKVETEYKSFLDEVWKKNAPDSFKDRPLPFEEWNLRNIVTEDDRVAVERAYRKATTMNLWKRITKNTHKDVLKYMDLLKSYTHEVLVTIRMDFMDEIEKNNIS